MRPLLSQFCGAEDVRPPELILVRPGEQGANFSIGLSVALPHEPNLVSPPIQSGRRESGFDGSNPFEHPSGRQHVGVIEAELR